MRILICDDDLSIMQSLSQIIKTYFNKKKVNNLDIITFNDGDSLLSDKSQKDIVFLDVEMPGFDGIYVGNELKKQNVSPPSSYPKGINPFIHQLSSLTFFNAFSNLLFTG